LWVLYHFCSVAEALATSQPTITNGATDNIASLYIEETLVRLAKYSPGKLRRKRFDIYLAMDDPMVL
jgi:hypothetical protein